MDVVTCTQHSNVENQARVPSSATIQHERLQQHVSRRVLNWFETSRCADNRLTVNVGWWVEFFTFCANKLLTNFSSMQLLQRKYDMHTVYRWYLQLNESNQAVGQSPHQKHVVGRKEHDLKDDPRIKIPQKMMITIWHACLLAAYLTCLQPMSL